MKGYCINLVSESFQLKNPCPSNIQSRSVFAESTGSKGINKQGCNFRSSGTPHRVLFKSVSITKKGWGSETCDKYESTKRVCSNATQMEEIHTLKELVRPGDWLAKVDLKDAYCTIPIHRKFLRFLFQEKTYEFICLPFGLRGSLPRTLNYYWPSYQREYSSTLYVGMARKQNGHPYISIASDELKSLVKL